MSIYDPENAHREQTELPPIPAHTAPIRYIHFKADGTELEFLAPPEGLAVLKVMLGRTRKQDLTVTEYVLTSYNWRSPGKGWELASGGRGNQWRWERRRRRVWS